MDIQKIRKTWAYVDWMVGINKVYVFRLEKHLTKLEDGYKKLFRKISNQNYTFISSWYFYLINRLKMQNLTRIRKRIYREKMPHFVNEVFNILKNFIFKSFSRHSLLIYYVRPPPFENLYGITFYPLHSFKRHCIAGLSLNLTHT